MSERDANAASYKALIESTSTYLRQIYPNADTVWLEQEAAFRADKAVQRNKRDLPAT
jgi:hypothetical protein